MGATHIIENDCNDSVHEPSKKRIPQIEKVAPVPLAQWVDFFLMRLSGKKNDNKNASTLAQMTAVIAQLRYCNREYTGWQTHRLQDGTGFVRWAPSDRSPEQHADKLVQIGKDVEAACRRMHPHNGMTKKVIDTLLAENVNFPPHVWIQVVDELNQLFGMQLLRQKSALLDDKLTPAQKDDIVTRHRSILLDLSTIGPDLTYGFTEKGLLTASYRLPVVQPHLKVDEKDVGPKDVLYYHIAEKLGMVGHPVIRASLRQFC